MYQWWFLINTGIGSFQKVYVWADNAYFATQQAKAIYGSQLMSESASRVP